MLRFIYHLNPFTNQSHQDFNEFNAFRIGAESIGIVSNYNATTKPIRQNSFAFLRDAPKILRILVNPFSIFLFSFAIFFYSYQSYRDHFFFNNRIFSLQIFTEKSHRKLHGRFFRLILDSEASFIFQMYFDYLISSSPLLPPRFI